jgi:hypothetical protein
MFILLRQLVCRRSPLSTAETRRCVRLGPEVRLLARGHIFQRLEPDRLRRQTRFAKSVSDQMADLRVESACLARLGI